MSEFIEYPQMLYRDDDLRIVADAEEHGAAKGENWLTWAEKFRPADPLDHDDDGRKGGSRKKVSAPAE